MVTFDFDPENDPCDLPKYALTPPPQPPWIRHCPPKSNTGTRGVKAYILNAVGGVGGAGAADTVVRDEEQRVG